MGNAGQEPRSKVIENLGCEDSKSTTPTGDRTMSLVTELEESAPVEEISRGVVSKLTQKLESATASTPKKVSKSTESRPSISEDDLRKEFSNLPRKK